MGIFPFKINPLLDIINLRASFERDGYVRVANFLAGGAAEELFGLLQKRTDWVQVVNSGDKVFDLSRPARNSMSATQINALNDAVYLGARTGFQYRYESIRVPDNIEDRRRSEDILARFAEWMSYGQGLNFLKNLTGFQDVDFVDAQATAYAPGDFLTAHDDAVPGKNRRAAYVLGLTPGWRVEWGGLLLLHAHDATSIMGAKPELNTLNVFSVPQQHSVSEVTRSAPHRRYAITGWLRTTG